MKLTTKSEYSILALIFIARNQRDHYIKTDEICKYYDIPRKYLEQLLMLLKQNGFIKARRGSAGGFRLAKDANTISIAQIIRLMDGALAPSESVSEYFYSETPLGKEEKMLSILKNIRDYIADVLENTTLQDLL